MIEVSQALSCLHLIEALLNPNCHAIPLFSLKLRCLLMHAHAMRKKNEGLTEALKDQDCHVTFASPFSSVLVDARSRNEKEF